VRDKKVHAFSSVFLVFFPTIRLPATFIFIVPVFMVYFILFSISSSLQPLLCVFYPFISLLFSPSCLYSAITYSYTPVTSFLYYDRKPLALIPQRTCSDHRVSRTVVIYLVPVMCRNIRRPRKEVPWIIGNGPALRCKIYRGHGKKFHGSSGMVPLCAVKYVEATERSSMDHREWSRSTL